LYVIFGFITSGRIANLISGDFGPVHESLSRKKWLHGEFPQFFATLVASGFLTRPTFRSTLWLFTMAMEAMVHL
jgi:hypothetical protein